MTLFYRIKRLIKADAYAFVEGMEEPKWVLAQAIRDMEMELEKQQQWIQEKKSALEQCGIQKDKYQEELCQIEKNIELALEEKREDIAKAQIKKQIIIKKQEKSMTDQIVCLSKTLQDNEAEFSKKRQAYDDIVSRHQTIPIESPKDPVFYGASQWVEREGNLEHEVELEFLRRLKIRKENKHGN